MSQGLGIIIIYFYCLAVDAGFYSDVVEYLPVDHATWPRFNSWLGQAGTLSTTVNSPSYDLFVHKYSPWSHFTRFLNQEIQRRIFQIGGGAYHRV